jgi:anti-sigma factor RsiW
MDCKRAIQLIALLPLETDGRERDEVARHLASCPACSKLALEDRQIRGLIRLGAPQSEILVTPKPGSVLRRIRQECREEVSLIRTLRRVAAGAALLFLCSAILIAWNVSNLPRKVEAETSIQDITICSKDMQVGRLIDDDNTILIAIRP